MSEELERRLRAAYDDLPLPSDDDTAAARRAFVAASPVPRTRPTRRVLALAFAVLALGAAAFGGGYAVASSAETPAKPAPRATLNAGPGFLPAEGWEVDATGAGWTTQAPVVVASNVPLAASALPEDAVERLGPNGILFRATFHPAGAKSAPRRLLPLQLRQASGSGATRRLLARVGRYDVEVVVAFGTAEPSAGVAAAAAQQLGRLVVPACPGALPLTEADLPAAEQFVLRWLDTHYQEDPADLAGARATSSLGSAMPRGGAARTACGVEVFRRTVEVDVVLPRLERVSASLSQLSYFVSRTRSGWIVWQRIH
jgi:hypothetical protein